MVDRPLEDKRPIGPVVDIDNLKQRMNNLSGGKSVVGVSGTPMPQRPKNRILVSYLLDGRHLGMYKKAVDNIEQKVQARYSDYRVEFKKSGKTSKGMFKNQAFIIRIPGSELPFNDEDLHRIADIIERNIDDVQVVQMIIDQE